MRDSLKLFVVVAMIFGFTAAQNQKGFVILQKKELVNPDSLVFFDWQVFALTSQGLESINVKLNTSRVINKNANTQAPLVLHNKKLYGFVDKTLVQFGVWKNTTTKIFDATSALPLGAEIWGLYTKGNIGVIWAVVRAEDTLRCGILIAVGLNNGKGLWAHNGCLKDKYPNPTAIYFDKKEQILYHLNSGATQERIYFDMKTGEIGDGPSKTPVNESGSSMLNAQCVYDRHYASGLADERNIFDDLSTKDKAFLKSLQFLYPENVFNVVVYNCNHGRSIVMYREDTVLDIQRTQAMYYVVLLQ